MSGDVQEAAILFIDLTGSTGPGRKPVAAAGGGGAQ